MSFITAAGVVGFSNQITRTAPNNVIPAAYFIATGLEANIDAVFGPKGTGAILGDLPNNLASGGNKRGANSVDFQTVRSAATAICSGPSSVLGGGNNNTVAADSAVCGGGLTNNISVVGQYGVINGGSSNDVTSQFGYVPYGLEATTRAVTFAQAYSAGLRVVKGDRQIFKTLAFRTTNDAVPITLNALGAGGGDATTKAALQNNTSASFCAYVSARDVSAAGDTASFKIEGTVKRGANAAATALVGAPIVTPLGADIGAAAWAATVVASATHGTLDILVTGAAGVNIAWNSELTMVSTG